MRTQLASPSGRQLPRGAVPVPLACTWKRPVEALSSTQNVFSAQDVFSAQNVSSEQNVFSSIVKPLIPAHRSLPSHPATPPYMYIMF